MVATIAVFWRDGVTRKHMQPAFGAVCVPKKWAVASSLPDTVFVAVELVRDNTPSTLYGACLSFK